jgi:hypothetical protein
MTSMPPHHHLGLAYFASSRESNGSSARANAAEGSATAPHPRHRAIAQTRTPTASS